mmetsp:Transcript_24956/g.36809  ORF Transcript_24956/g.36809 Transcript_24956/m.36809 type:complete len:316 (-) Transcript_24956:231-1178(-)|eukprot:CAMPEP_0185025296 /NCGR_PEP_ID=MMETSP1103-20130426/8310_1 /TAXON_ID=36769 /ORGANISM="Paraphysomonas bandaiensis, Strain Caron Lab Isolate" /LENGTH=315 /DNA_ID=CAMNT_0027558467 /DNA_START=107 /DNA_END=1054 /DNA_ORIENTATION=-
MSVLSREEIVSRLSTRPLWKLTPDGKLRRTFEAKNFHAALNFIVTIGNIADHHHHHPDLHLTGYKNVEVVLYTHRLSGLTEMDFEMADLFDKIPVNYSLMWKRNHPDLLDHSEPPPTSSESHKRPARALKYDTIFRRPPSSSDSISTPIRTHHPKTPPTSPPQCTQQPKKPAAVSSPPEPSRLRIPSPQAPPPPPPPCHGVALTPRSMHKHIQLKKRNPTNLETPEENEAWKSMAAALQTLIDNGYDIGIGESLLPMVNAHEVYPNWEEEMHSAYVHLNKRLSPSWLDSEPTVVIQACMQFVEGYNVIFSDNFMT